MSTPTAPSHAAGLAELPTLVNQLTQELAQAQRNLAGAQQKLASATRSLEARTQALSEARAALALLLATLDSTSEGILALGHFGRAMHYNARFIEMWHIPAARLEGLNEPALLALQLAQVRDPARFLAEAEARRAQPEQAQHSLIERTDGRIYECEVLPQRVRGRRLGSVTRYRDVTERERLHRLLAQLESELPAQVAEARASCW